ncbi:MAG TPA: sensor histidine kinase [Arthrobacter sp.]|nr:sensor histidine kinase [Arthrobacter sp.]
MSTLLAPPDPTILPGGNGRHPRSMAHALDDRANDRSAVRQTVTVFLILGIVAMILVSVPAVAWVRAQALDHALGNIAARTEQMARHSFSPFVDEPFLAGDPEARQELDAVVDGRIAEGSLMRVKIINEDGVIVYSDEERLIGKEMPLPGRAAALFDGGETIATLQDPHPQENLLEGGKGQLVEVYTLAPSAAGPDLIFEAYYPAGPVLENQRQLFLQLAPGVLLALILLQAAQLPLALWLSRRVQSHQIIRRRLLRQSIAASELERKRIARDLHDDVIQDLAGMSYALESVETHTPETVRPTIIQARTILQNNVGTLRGMLSELYPGDLDRMGLPRALNRLADPLREQGTVVTLDVPERFEVSKPIQTLLYRVAREVLMNTAKHAQAESVTVTLDMSERTARLSITDDGIGMDPSAKSQEGHLGLRLVQDTVAEAGGTIEIKSRFGEGTCVTTSIPTGS